MSLNLAGGWGREGTVFSGRWQSWQTTSGAGRTVFFFLLVFAVVCLGFVVWSSLELLVHSSLAWSPSCLKPTASCLHPGSEQALQPQTCSGAEGPEGEPAPSRAAEGTPPSWIPVSAYRPLRIPSTCCAHAGGGVGPSSLQRKLLLAHSRDPAGSPEGQFGSLSGRCGRSLLQRVTAGGSGGSRLQFLPNVSPQNSGPQLPLLQDTGRKRALKH